MASRGLRARAAVQTRNGGERGGRRAHEAPGTQELASHQTAKDGRATPRAPAPPLRSDKADDGWMNGERTRPRERRARPLAALTGGILGLYSQSTDAAVRTSLIMLVMTGWTIRRRI